VYPCPCGFYGDSQKPCTCAHALVTKYQKRISGPLLAIGALRAAPDLKLHVPNDLSLVGYDNIPMANYLIPRLTTVTKDAYTLGTQAFEMLLARMQNPDLPRQLIQHPPRLIIRESPGQAPF